MEKKAKILIVDDEETVRLGLEEELSGAGYEVASAPGGEEASEIVQREKIALAFVDLWMPGMDGVETCRAIKRLSPDTEVVLISGRPDGFSGREGEFIKSGGLDFFLYKPFMEGEVLATVRKVLQAQQGSGRQ